MNVSTRTNEELINIYTNIKTSAKIIGFASQSDCRMLEEIEIEAAKRQLNLEA